MTFEIVEIPGSFTWWLFIEFTLELIKNTRTWATVLR